MISLVTIVVYSQDITKFNLPPGTAFAPKLFQEIDYSYKLDQNLNLPINKKFLKFSKEELIVLKKKNKKTLNYYLQAKDYFNCLSDKVKKSYTVNELWYIYVFDRDLKNNLTLIK
jgi:hypothetical protein